MYIHILIKLMHTDIIYMYAFTHAFIHACNIHTYTSFMCAIIIL